MVDEPRSYPSMPTKHWWALRDRFRRTIPSKVDANYISSALDMTERSAQNNILPALRSTKLIDEDGKPTDRAVKWRDDGHYAEVCEAIRVETYPKGLLDLAPADSVERAEVERWFANTARVGEGQAAKLASFFILLSQADPTKSTAAEPDSGPKNPRKKSVSKVVTPRRSSEKRDPEPKRNEEKPVQNSVLGPAFHFNIQIHISPDSTAQQIDQIFESMARHLKDLR